MGRPKTIIDAELVSQAKNELESYKNHRVYLRLLAVVKAGEHSIAEVAVFFNVARDTVSRWIKRYRKYGVVGLFDKPRGHNPSKLNEEHKRVIASWLDTGKNADGEPIHWTLASLIYEINRHYGVSISEMPLWMHIKKMGFKQKVPRPVHVKSSKEEKDTYKKNPGNRKGVPRNT